ncbi:meiosis protein SPO22/ZIP4 like-domain-containing protein [Suillus clintonianus]|uniref:meiosis protein SPO22/ZIP4 like-domain-containing protein n=1 Tax=Suillus clintonianus TaxID=1904413 RepID=UPI001B886C5E|nr:meiosis protein SPO22/ZIP4 like-domain-containing protein [Suillus clintonianus]KAG2135130.1 meiosis protein SPO22/ZIP4 like-domain-containing protein [Suillus clintonianus]
MSPGGKKSRARSPQELYDEIKELLIKTKPKLKDAITTKDETITRDLHKIASLAQIFTEQRLKTSKNSQLSDLLDQEGVNLWNASGVVRQGSAHDSRAVVAALRLAGFRLMEAGLEPKPDAEALLHILQIASKTGATLSELGHNDTASSVLGCAAKYEEALRNIDDPSGTNHQAKACVTAVYLSTRMEAAWREGNEGLAAFMADKITETLATKLLDIGKSLLRSCYQDSKSAPEENKAQDAIRWMQKAFSVIEPLDCATNAELVELKRSVLRSLGKAETALEEVIATIDPSVDNVRSEYQQLRWMKLAVIKRRKAGDTVLLQALQAIIDNMSYSESNLTDQLVTSAIQYCLHRALQCSWSTDAVERLLISLVFHCSKDDKHDRAVQDLHASFKELSDVEFELLKAPATACITLLWQYGDRHYHAGRWKEAADWFSCGTHSIFASLGPVSSSKCFRKAALAHLKRKDYAHAGSVIRRCPDTEATTQYVTFLIAVHQAIQSIRNMVHAVNFDRKMILLACRLAHDMDMKNLLLNVLKALLETLNFRENVENITEAMALVRCIIRLIIKLLGEPAADLERLVASLLHHLKIVDVAAVTVAESCEQPAMLVRDVSWLWRTAYNCAIQACSDWEDRENQISDIFDAARRFKLVAQLLELYILHATVEVDQAIYVYLVNASFASASGRVMSFRRLRSQTESIEPETYRDLFNEVNQSSQRIVKVLREEKVSQEDLPRLQSSLQILRVFIVEAATHLSDWNTVLATIEGRLQFPFNKSDRNLFCIQEASRSDRDSLETYEAFADTLATLHACLARGHFSLEKFSRWLRAMCLILLTRATGSDRSKAIGYVDQAIAVLEEHGDARDGGDLLYPLDERQWLLSTAYNTGLECLHASMVDEAKRWFECSTVICRFVPDGRQRAEKVGKTQ